MCMLVSWQSIARLTKRFRCTAFSVEFHLARLPACLPRCLIVSMYVDGILRGMRKVGQFVHGSVKMKNAVCISPCMRHHVCMYEQFGNYLFIGELFVQGLFAVQQKFHKLWLVQHCMRIMPFTFFAFALSHTGELRTAQDLVQS